MSWSDWTQTTQGNYNTQNLDTSSVGKDSVGLPKAPSVPVLPTSPNCNYRVYGAWKFLINGRLFNPSETLGRILLYSQRMWNGQIFDSSSIGFPTYHNGRFASFNGVIKVDNSVQYGNQNAVCALGEVFYSAYGIQTPFLYGNWQKNDNIEIVFTNIFVEGASNCDLIFSPSSQSPSPTYKGTASPPPPPQKNMKCCDCNTIATIVEARLANQNKQVKDHVDQRTIEQLKSINKMLQGMTIDLDLQPVIDRLNEVEANLWNGPQGE